MDIGSKIEVNNLSKMVGKLTAAETPTANPLAFLFSANLTSKWSLMRRTSNFSDQSLFYRGE
jgi:hypothetical protein